MIQLPNTHPVKSPFEDQIVSIHQDFILEVCMKEASKRLAFAIRYRAYLEAEMIPENKEGLLFDDYDFLPNARIFLVWYQGKAVATVRSCIYSDSYDWILTEAVSYFSKELQLKLHPDSRLLESNRFAVDPDFQGKQSLFARFLLFRAHGLNAAVHGCKYIMTSVVPNHVAFYRRFLNLEPISETPQYVEWVGTEVSLLINETHECLNSILKRGMPAYGEEDIKHYAMRAQLKVHDNQ